MSRTARLAERIRLGEPIAPPLAMLLSAATLVQRVGMGLRARQRPVRTPARVISIGNLTAGGTGKTPAVIECARRELAQGRRVAVVSRGYGSARTPEPLVLEGSPFAPGLARRFGDEPVLIARAVSGVRVVKAADRVRGAHCAISELGCDTLILDDGFQYLRLARDENVLLIDATNPFGNGRLMPRGILREPIRAAARASAIILTRCDQTEDLDALAERLRALNPGAPIRFTRHAPARLWRVADGREEPLEALRDRPVIAVCAIAAPERFFATLESLGARVEDRHAHPDHARFDFAHLPEDRWVLTTEKDAVRMDQPPESVYALGIELEDIRPECRA